MKKVLIWAETSPEIGMGHVKRCLVLADRLTAEGFSVEFVTYKESHVEYNNYHVNWISHLGKFLMTSGYNYDYFITDTYDLTTKDIKIIRQSIKHIIVIDDLNNLDYYNVDLVINGDYQAKSWKYSCAGKVLLGTDYLLLDKKFVPNYKAKKSHILVLTGATNDALVEKMQNLIFEKLGPSNLMGYMFIFPNLSEYNRAEEPIQQLMQESYLTVTAGGMSIYEALACDVPVIGYAVADNQIPVVEALANDGLITYAKTLEEIPSLIDRHPAINLPIYNTTKFRIDNLGAQRIVEEIKALS